jgi:hypothetical protein
MTAISRATKERQFLARAIAIRVGGAALLGLCAFAARALRRLANQLPPHGGAAFELLLLGVATFLSFTCGLALLLEGSGLFEFVPVPQRNRFTGF